MAVWHVTKEHASLIEDLKSQEYLVTYVILHSGLRSLCQITFDMCMKATDDPMCVSSVRKASRDHVRWNAIKDMNINNFSSDFH